MITQSTQDYPRHSQFAIWVASACHHSPVGSYFPPTPKSREMPWEGGCCKGCSHPDSNLNVLIIQKDQPAYNYHCENHSKKKTFSLKMHIPERTYSGGKTQRFEKMKVKLQTLSPLDLRLHEIDIAQFHPLLLIYTPD